ncbi:hypothetical protein KAU34_01415, partial [candidate division WOR-3 bacterium]|nr:hypothetical protein [candidate division WOR-3 bacterium]
MLRKTLRLSIIGINIMLICKCLSAGNWSYTDSMNITRHHHTTTLLQDGKVLVCAGGWNGLYQTASCQIYSPLTYTWSSTDSLHIHREKHTATLLPDGKVLVSGGWPITSSCEIYDPQTEEWAYTDSMNGQRVYHTAT